MFKGFIDKIKATKKVAAEKNVHTWHNCVFHSVIIIIAFSMILSVLTITSFSDMNMDTTIGELLVNMQLGLVLPLIYGVTLSYLFLEKLIVLHIMVFSKLNKLVLKGWERFDLWYFKKYKKESPITNNLAKIQRKFGRHQSKRVRKLLIIAVIALVIVLNISLRGPMIMDMINTEPITEIEQIPELEQPIQERVIVR